MTDRTENEIRMEEGAKSRITQQPSPPRPLSEDEVVKAAEARLVQQATEGDTHALEKLYEVSLEPVYRYIYRRTENVFEAENLTSETFTRAVDALAQGRYDYRQGRPFRAWLVGIAANILQERYRALKNTPVIEDLNDILENNEPTSGGDDPLDWIVQQEEKSALWQLVEKLPVLEQSVIVLRHVYELSYAKIAERLNRSENSCKQLHYRALKKLKKLADEQEARLRKELGEE